MWFYELIMKIIIKVLIFYEGRRDRFIIIFMYIALHELGVWYRAFNYIDSYYNKSFGYFGWLNYTPYVVFLINTFLRTRP